MHVSNWSWWWLCWSPAECLVIHEPTTVCARPPFILYNFQFNINANNKRGLFERMHIKLSMRKLWRHMWNRLSRAFVINPKIKHRTILKCKPPSLCYALFLCVKVQLGSDVYNSETHLNRGMNTMCIAFEFNLFIHSFFIVFSFAFFRRKILCMLIYMIAHNNLLGWINCFS